ncbi:MAG TPA: CDP-alcohol phosphatidyltransferase family protein [bacterium]|nr:CDP-alcohol phosphatidyltransferase family protein [bacterium]HPG45731.1 CDP-alcohol phosphatidyltransferase family protein [bacterium]HPM97490.1 CDP-alcohol phosphatidyltransferase family protein [bacterium]
MKWTLFSDSLKNRFRLFFDPLVGFLVRRNFNPNHLTTLSLLFCAIASYFFAKGALRWGAFYLLVGGTLDMIDGSVARASNRVTKFGALYDSTLDRYAEILVFLGIGIHFTFSINLESNLRNIAIIAVFLSLAGSVMVSYVRARAEGLGFDCRVGLLQRPERLVALSIGLLISEIALIVVMLLIAALANFTAVQRIYHIWSTENSERWKKLPTDLGHE